MKNILIVGCSFSKFLEPEGGLPYEWPVILASKLNARVYNMSMLSNSLQNQAFQLEQYLAYSDIKYDLVIVQLTHTRRATYVEDWDHYRKFLHTAVQDHPSKLNNYYCLPDHAGTVPIELIHYTEYNVDSKSRNVNPSIIKWSTKKSPVRKHYLYSITHELSYLNDNVSEGLALYMLDILKDSKIPYIYYSQSHPFKYAEFVVESLLPNTLPSRHPDSFFYDKGKHLNKKGAHWFVDNIMLEKVLKYV